MCPPAPDAFADPHKILEVSEGLEALGNEAKRGAASGPTPVHLKPRSSRVLSGYKESTVGSARFPVLTARGKSSGETQGRRLGEEAPTLVVRVLR